MKMGAIAVPAIFGDRSFGCCLRPHRCGILCITFGGGGGLAAARAGGSGGGNCFLKGTSILTANGERRIEDLAIGDLLPTMFGGLRPIQWIGRYPRKKSDPSKPWVKDALPVRIARSALAPNVPHADLYVTASP